MEGISLKPPFSLEFLFFYTKITPNICGVSTSSMMYISIPYGKIVLARKCVKVEVNTPNTELSAVHVTAVYSQLVVISEDTHKENIH